METQIGPSERYTPAFRRQVCDGCQYCKKSEVFGQKRNEILMAECRHPNIELFFNMGKILDVSSDGQYVPTPNDCPVLQKERFLSGKF